MNPILRPLDIVYPLFERVQKSEDLVPLQLGLLSIAGYLLKEGFDVQYHDLCHFEGVPSQKPRLRVTLDHLLKKYDPAIVGLTSYTSNFNASLKVVALLKEINPNLLICVGGPHVTFLDKYSIEESGNRIDVVVRGEGERTMHDIVQCNKKGKPLEENVRGITTNKKRTPDQALLSNEELNKIPPLPFELIPKKERRKTIYLPLNATRGCSYRCTFCTNPIFWGHTVRFRNPESIIREILIAEELFPKMMIDFTDTILPAKVNHFEELVNQYTTSVKTPVLMALTRANLTDNKRLKLMKTLLGDKGYLTIGLENGNPRILELMHKPTWDTQLTALKNIKEFGIRSIPSWMVGFCGEDRLTMQENMDKLECLYKNQLIDSVIIFIWIPIPGSLPFRNPKEFGLKIHTINWDFYDRAVFPPPYSLFNPKTGEKTLSSLQIWSYYLDMIYLQKAWSEKMGKSEKRRGPKEKMVQPHQFIRAVSKNPEYLYFNPTGESNLTVYEELLKDSFGDVGNF
jgi:radical SAM superfamily enzyme YgiQ (UPF0313 family)